MLLAQGHDVAMTNHRSAAALSAIPSLHCPDCGAPMRLLAMMSTASARDVDATTYRCEVCNVEMNYRAVRLAA
jgi:DNA-directed RNA polymerase subunit M/transcription elongation factor TFIIS